MTPLPVPSLPDRLRAHAHLHPETAELLREAADVIDLCDEAVARDAKVRAGEGLRLPLPDLLMYLLTSPTDAQWREARVDPTEVACAVRAVVVLLGKP